MRFLRSSHSGPSWQRATLQYARDMVAPSLWENPGFIRVNVLMTGIWGGIFTINLVLEYLAFAYPGTGGGIALLLTYPVLIASIVFTIWYPRHIRGTRAPVPGEPGT